MAAIIKPKGFKRKASAKLPCTICVRLRVLPQEGKAIQVTFLNGQGVKELWML